MLKNVLLAMVVLIAVTQESFGEMVFSENMGTPSGTTSTSSNIFQNSGTFTFTGTGDVRSTSPSNVYAGASAGGNVFLTNTAGTNFTIGGINTSNYVTGSLTLTFGALKSSTASNLTELQVSYSTDSLAFTSLAFAAQPTGNGTAVWRSVAIYDANLIPISSTLSLRWTNLSTTPSFRIDDIAFNGSVTAVPEPTSIALVSLMCCTGFVAAFRRRIAKSKIA